jgi:hypothetical protein
MKGRHMNRVPQHSDDRPRRDDLIGYHVESVGGSTGRIDAVTRAANERYLVIRTGRWPVRHRVVVPAGAINCIDPRRRTLWVERDRNDVRNGPAFDETRHGPGPVDVAAD